jgi:sugar lactone lactonase YvrE
MRLLRFLGIVLVVAVGAGSLALSGGKEIRVPQDYKTIQEAINAASEGDTILVDVGTYKETIEIPKGLTLVGAERDKTIIDGGGLELGVVTISSAALVTVRNVTITNGRDGVLVERGAQALLRQARIAQNKRHGVLVLGQAQLLGNLIHNNGNCGVNAFPGAQVQGSGNIIRDNGGGDLCGDVPAQLKAEGGPPPPVVRLSPSEWTNRNQFTLDWENPDYPARITAAWYKVGGAPTSSEDGRRTTEKPLQLQSPSEGRQAVYLWLEDELGQKDHRNASQASMLLDQTPPTISAAVNPQPNAQGWNNTDVTVRFSCQDALSGVASCTPTDPIQVTQEGQGQTIQAQAVDKAGNRAERTVTVNLDKTKPQLTLGEPQGTLGSEGWYRTDVVVPYTATDNLAGFSGGQRQLQGSARSSGEGSAVRVRVRVEDLAGNATEAEAGPFKVDQTPPTISAAVNPQPNAQGWNNTDVTVRFQCSDALSGLVSCTPQEERVTSEGERRIEGRAEDRAGNVRTTSVTVRLDKTPPRVSCQPPDTTRWYREDVSVPCTASDSLSGLANSADASFTLIARGEGQAVSTGTRTVADRAGNSVTAGPYTFQIDKTPPTGSLTINDGAASTTSITVTLRITANDNLSGVAQMRFSNDGWTWSGWEPFNPTRPGWNLSAFGGNSRPGKKTVFAQLQDRAGNISTPLQAEIMFRPLVGNPLFVAANGASFSGTGNGTLVKIDISVPFPFPTTIVKGLDSPADAVCGPDKKIYFADWFSGRIYRVEQDGRNLTVLATVTSPQGVTFSDSGDLYVSAADGIWRLRGGRGPVEKVARYTTSSNFLQGAGGLIFIPQGPFAGDLLVVDTGRNRVVRFPAPNFDRAVDFITTGLDRPIGIAVNSQGEIYVSNFASRQINRYNYRGEFLGVLGEQIGLNVYRPIHMEFGPDDTLYTAEWGDFVGEGWVARINISGELAVIIAIVDAWGLALC